jgi:peptidyl-tRNA hydrolase
MNKMYIAVLDEVPDHMVPVLVAHAVLGAHMYWTYSVTDVDLNVYDEWVEGSFRKVVLKVNRKEFEKMRILAQVYEAHENTTLDGNTSALVLCPRAIWPNVVKFAKMWKPNAQEALDRLPEEIRYHYDA